MRDIDILGYEISSEDLDAVVEKAWNLKDKGGMTHFVACANPHSLVVARSDKAFHNALKQADILLPDGVGIIVAGKILKKQFQERVAGNEFFMGFTRKAQWARGLRYFFLGSSKQVLDRMVSRLNREFPLIDVCGVFSPPFKARFTAEESRAMVDAINHAKPDVLWVGMTAPKQEKWIEENRSRLKVPLAVAIGAVFDFYAGTKKRAPKWMQAAALEWLPRLLREPGRLWRRNLVSTPAFLIEVLGQRFKGMDE